MTTPLPGSAPRPGTGFREDGSASAYARAEGQLDAYYARRRRRGPEVLLAVLGVLVLAVAVVVAVDLRRLQTPRGTALNWTGAAVFGDCTGYARLSIADPRARRPERRTASAVCRDLREQTADARTNAARTGFDVVRVRETGAEAVVRIVLRRPDGDEQVDLPLVRRGDGWAVVRTPAVCLAVGCA